MNKKYMIGTIVAVSVFAGTVMGAELSFRDQIVKDDIYHIIAESPTETVLTFNSRLFPARQFDSLIKYCQNIGGTPSVGRNWITGYPGGVFNTGLALDVYKNQANKSEEGFINCTAPNGKGFTSKRHEVKTSKDSYYDLAVYVKHESQQPAGYALKTLKKEISIDGQGVAGLMTKPKDVYGYCALLGGKSLVANNKTMEYAVAVNEYLLWLGRGGTNIRTNHEHKGRIYCVDTTNPAKEFTVTLSLEKAPITFRSGVDKTALKYNTDPVPPYLVAETKPEMKIDVVQPSSSVAVSKAPTSAEIDAAKRVFATKNTVLSRTGTYVAEGMYLGSDRRGACELAAVSSLRDNPIGLKSVYDDKDAPLWIYNFKQCPGKEMEYIGESFEKKAPTSIALEYRRVFNTCRIRGAASGEYLGYTIDCTRQGAERDTVYEMTIIKNDKLVARGYEK